VIYVLFYGKLKIKNRNVIYITQCIMKVSKMYIKNHTMLFISCRE